jgi:WD40 repeat protein
VAVGDNDGSITLWRLDEPGSAPLTLDAEAPLISLALSADGRHLAASTEARDLLRWDLQAEEPVRRRLPDVHPAGFHDLIFAPTEDTLYALAPSEPRSFVYTWFPDGSRTQDRPFLPIAFSPDGELVALANPNPTLFPVSELILVARAGTNNLFLTDEADATLQPPLSFSPDNQLLADTPGNQIRLWSLAAGGARGTAEHRGHAGGPTCRGYRPGFYPADGAAFGKRRWHGTALAA